MLDDLTQLDPGNGRWSRAEFLRGGLVAGGGIVVAGVLLGELPAPAESAPSPEQDAEILNFVLRLEHLQVAFYAEALDRGQILGEPREFARVVGGHERDHVAFIEQTLGGAARPAPGFDFGEATADQASFLAAAGDIEDLAVGAYNAQAPNLTPGAFKAAARIVSVEARHAAWIRDVAGLNPAPEASEPVTTAARVMSTVRDTGFVQ